MPHLEKSPTHTPAETTPRGEAIPYLPSEGVDLQGKLLQERRLGGVGKDEHHVHVARP